MRLKYFGCGFLISFSHRQTDWKQILASLANWRWDNPRLVRHTMIFLPTDHLGSYSTNFGIGDVGKNLLLGKQKVIPKTLSGEIDLKNPSITETYLCGGWCLLRSQLAIVQGSTSSIFANFLIDNPKFSRRSFSLCPSVRETSNGQKPTNSITRGRKGSETCPHPDSHLLIFATAVFSNSAVCSCVKFKSSRFLYKNSLSVSGWMGYGR